MGGSTWMLCLLAFGKQFWLPIIPLIIVFSFSSSFDPDESSSILFLSMESNKNIPYNEDTVAIYIYIFPANLWKSQIFIPAKWESKTQGRWESHSRSSYWNISHRKSNWIWPDAIQWTLPECYPKKERIEETLFAFRLDRASMNPRKS